MKTLIYILFLAIASASAAEVGRVGTIPGSDDEMQRHVQSLSSSEEGVSDRAKVMLLRPEFAARIPAHRDELLAKLSSVTCEADAVILGRLDLSATRVAELLASPHCPDMVKAKLGDAEAQTRVVNRFQAAATVHELRKTALDLAYLDNQLAAVELGKRLESKDVLTDVHGNMVSVVVLILQAYWFEHQDKPLFSPREYTKYADLKGEQFRGVGPQSYLRQIEAHFNEKFSLKLTIDPPLLLEASKKGVRKKITSES